MLSFEKKNSPRNESAKVYTVSLADGGEGDKVLSTAEIHLKLGPFLIGCCVCLMFKNLCMFTQILPSRYFIDLGVSARQISSPRTCFRLQILDFCV